MADPSSEGRSKLAPDALTASARALCDWLADHDWDFRRAAAARRIEPRVLYREWLEALGWNQSLAARLYRRNGRAVTRQAIEAQMKSFGVVRPLDLSELLKGQDLAGALDALRATQAFVLSQSSPERLCCEQLLALAETYQTLGTYREARAALVEVVKLARRSGALELVERAVRVLGQTAYQVRRYGSYDAELVDLLEGWLVSLRERPDESALAVALGLLAHELYGSGRVGARERARDLAAEGLQCVRASNSTRDLSIVTGEWVLTRSDTQHLDERLETLTELVANMPLDAARRYFILDLLLSDLLEAGRVEETELVCRELRTLEDTSGLPWPQRYRVTLYLLRGDWQEAERLARKMPGEVPLESAAQVRGIQQFESMKLRGDWETLAGLVRWNLNQEPEFIGWQIAMTLVSSLLGRLDGVAATIETWAEDDFRCLPDDFMWLPDLCMLSEVCFTADCREPAARLYELLVPFRERVCVIRVTAGILGSVARYLGLLATTLGDFDRATSDFEQALLVNEKLRAGPYLAWTRYDYACMLHRSGRATEKALSLVRSASAEAAKYGMDWLVTRADSLAAELREKVASL